MKAWSAIFSLIAVWILMIMMAVAYRQLDAIQTDYDTAVLRQVIDYAGKAAFEKAKKSGQLGISYIDIDSVRLDPSEVLKEFENIVCMSYNMSLSDENRVYIESFISAAVLCTYDGYYVAQRVDDTSTILEWSLKIPYTYTSKDGTKVVTLNMNVDKGYVIDKATGDVSEYNAFGAAETGIQATELNRNIANARINSIINNVLSFSVAKTTADIGGKWYRVYIPAKTTITGINTINKPSLIILLEGGKFAGKAKIREAAISGLTVVSREWIVGYKDMDGNMLYCYESQLSDLEIRENNLEIYNKPFSSTKEANKYGYNPDYRRLVRTTIVGYVDTATNEKFYCFENQLTNREIKEGIVKDVVSFKSEQEAKQSGYQEDKIRLQK